MENNWDKLHTQPRFCPKYPNDNVIRFILGNFPKNSSLRKKNKILDLGCGAGRHTLFLAREGFNTFGMDGSKKGILVTKKRLNQEKLNATLQVGDIKALPYPDNYFDGIISFGVIYYNNIKGIKQTISEIKRIVKPKGKIFIFTRTNQDYRYKKGKKIDSNTFKLNIPETNESSMEILFMSKTNIYNFFRDFKIINIEKIETTFCNLKFKNSDWIITLEKE